MRDERGASAVLGGVIMLSLVAMMVPSAVMLKAALVDEMDAHREAAELAAWCARNPDAPSPPCPARGPMPGYACEQVAADTWVCTATAAGAGDALKHPGNVTLPR